MNYNRSKLLEIFEIGLRVGNVNLARKKFMLNFAIGIILSRNVHFACVADHFDPEVELASHIRRAERFFNEYKLDYVQIAVLLMCFLPAGRVHISMDRTNWQFGKHNINFLAITAYCKGVGIPLMFELLDKKGNSDTQERKLLFRKLLRILPAKQISGFTADREFVGEQWYKFLISNKIPFYIRIKSNTMIEYRGIIFHARHFAVDKHKRFFENVKIHGLKLHLATKRISHKEEEEAKYLLILTNANVQKAIDLYRSRWSIEVFFQSIKKRGFNLENTHMTDLPRLKKLFAIVCLAFACCLKVGVWKHQNRRPLKKKSNGYKPYSFFRYGLNELRKALLHFHKIEKFALQIFDMIIRDVKENYQMWNTLYLILRI
ncbi:MAG TPA: IS4 family transposase [Saprospiraceae bacterium]|nr:IS4 family transposase [Saprospiraceae bacterium]